MSRLSWSTAAKIAWRESRASTGRFAFVVLAVAIGVGSLTGVRGFSNAFRDMLLREARTLMAGDLSVRIFALPTAEQQAAMDSLAGRGVDRTQITETLTMANSERVADPILVSVKAVDPAKYPFYGELQLHPAQPLRTALRDDTAVLSPDLFERLGVTTDDSITLGGGRFRVAARIEAEPDKMSGSMNVGPRVLITRAALERTGLLGLGSRAAQRFLFRLAPRAPAVAAVRAELQRVFPEARIVDYRETNPQITAGLDRATTFLTLITLIALIVGALGVGTAMHAHLQGKLDNIAVIKSLGGTSGGVLRIYVLQTLMLGALGGVLGVMAGLAVQALFPLLIVRYFQIRPDVSLDLMTSGQGLLAGVLTTLLFTIPPLAGIRAVKPNLIFRREMTDAGGGWRTRVAQARTGVLAGLLILAGVFALALWLIGGTVKDALRVAAYFAGGLAVALAVLSAGAWVLLRLLRLFIERAPLRLPATVRHGIANVYRPGTHAPAVLTALGVGVMFTLTVYLIQHNVLREMARNSPPGMPNVFLLDITPAQRAGVLELLNRYADRKRPPELISTVAARLVAVDGKPVASLQLEGFARRFRGPRSLATAAEMPPGTRILEGEWWKPGSTEPLVALGENAAKSLGVKPGSTLEWTAYGRPVRARVAAIHQMEAARLRAFVDFVVSPGLVEGIHSVNYGAARVAPERVGRLQAAMYGRFPTVTVINMADITNRIEEVVDQISLVVRFISAFAILAGITILASSVAGTRFRRVRETAILKALGATRRRVVAVFSAEFLILGTAAGLIGAGLASGFSGVLLNRLLNAPYQLHPGPLAVAIAATAVLAVGAGWLASWRILSEKPLEVLRHE